MNSHNQLYVFNETTHCRSLRMFVSQQTMKPDPLLYPLTKSFKVLILYFLAFSLSFIVLYIFVVHVIGLQ